GSRPRPPAAVGSRSALPGATARVRAPEPLSPMPESQPALPSPSVAPATAALVIKVSVGSGSHQATSDTEPGFRLDPEATPIVALPPGELHARAEADAARFELEPTAYETDADTALSAEERDTLDESAHFIDTPVRLYPAASPDVETDDDE